MMSLSKGYDVPQFTSLVAASIARPLPELTPRDVEMPRISRKADVVIGMRRSGKTYALYQEMHRLLAEGVPRDRMLYMNLEDDRLGQPDLAGLDQMLETFYRLSPAAREHGAFIFLDEVQVVEGWSRFARRVLDTEAARLYVTGSSAKMLSTEVATEFRGRGFAVELLPFSFRESLRHGGIDIPEAEPGSALRSRLEAHLATYLEVGGFPDVQTLDGEKRIQTLQDYVELVLVRDVIERHGHAHVAAVRAFAAALLRASAQTFSVNKVFNDLTSRGLKVGKDTLHALLDELSDAFLVFPVSIFRRSLRARQIAPKKAYAVDPGLALAMSHALTEDVGRRLETTVYLELRRRLGRVREGAISYYVTEDGHEVDFVVGDRDEPHVAQLVQSCVSLRDTPTRVRELRALEEAMTELGRREATIVTLYERDTVEVGAGIVEVVPAWRWLLGLE